MSKRRKKIDAWLLKGYKKGYISNIFCFNHEICAIEDFQLLEQLIEEHDNDYCLSVVRIKYEDE